MNLRNLVAASRRFGSEPPFLVMPWVQNEPKFALIPSLVGRGATPQFSSGLLASAPRRNEPSMCIDSLPFWNAVVAPSNRSLLPVL